MFHLRSERKFYPCHGLRSPCVFEGFLRHTDLEIVTRNALFIINPHPSLGVTFLGLNVKTNNH